MHIPDGFLSPETYFSLYAINTPLWIYSIKKFRNELQHKEIPILALSSALAFVITSIQFPVPGGTSVHLIGIFIFTYLFGIWKTYFLYTIIFLLQFFLLGLGGITTLPLHSIGIGLTGSFSIWLILYFLKNKIPFYILVLSGCIIGILSSIIFISLILGLQPEIAYNDQGKPLYFPFSWNIVLPSMIIAHIPVMIIESVVSTLFIKFYENLSKIKY